MGDDHTVLGRAIMIIDAVVDAVLPLPLAVLTRRTGIPKPSVRRLANDLVRRGMLEQTPEGYVPGRRLIHQGLHSAHHHGEVVTVQPYLQDLHLRTRGQVAFAAMMNDGQLSLTGAAFGRLHASEMRKPWFPTLSAMGPAMVLLASGRLEVAHDEKLADRILHRGWPPLTRYSVIDKRKMRSLFDEARDTGFAHEIEESRLGNSCMAVALRDPSERLAGVLGVAGQCTAIEARGVRAALVRSAELLQRDLRASSEHGTRTALDVLTFNGRTGIGYSWSMPARHGGQR